MLYKVSQQPPSRPRGYAIDIWCVNLMVFIGTVGIVGGCCVVLGLSCGLSIVCCRESVCSVVLPSPLSFSWVFSGCCPYRLELHPYPAAVTQCPFLLQSCLPCRCNFPCCLSVVLCVRVYVLCSGSKLPILSCSCCIVYCVLYHDFGVFLHLILLLSLMCRLTLCTIVYPVRFWFHGWRRVRVFYANVVYMTWHVGYDRQDSLHYCSV